MSRPTETGTSSSPDPIIGTSLGRRPALDGVRGVAILLVFFVHFRFANTGGPVGRFVDEVFRAGWVGVDLFFVLSGFLITGVLMEARGGQHFFRNFYIRRFLRLFPVYYATLAVIFWVLPRVLDPVPDELATLVPYQGWYWSYTVNVLQALTHDRMSYFNTLHFWSLAVEEQFYLVWPLLVWLASPRALLRLAVGAVVVGVAFRIVTAHLGHPWAAYVLTPGRLDALAIGAILAVLARDPAGSAWIRRWWKPALLVGGLGIASIVVFERGYHEDRFSVLTAGFLLNAVVAGALIAGVLVEPGRPGFRALGANWLQWVGRCSYGAYVYHLPLQRLLGAEKEFLRSLPPVLGTKLFVGLLWMGLMTAVTLIVAGLSYRWFERPFLRWKEHWASPPGR